MTANAYLYLFGLVLIQNSTIDYRKSLHVLDTDVVKLQNAIFQFIFFISFLASAFLFKWYFPIIGLVVAIPFFWVARPIYRAFIFAHQLFIVLGVSALLASLFWQ